MLTEIYCRFTINRLSIFNYIKRSAVHTGGVSRMWTVLFAVHVGKKCVELRPFQFAAVYSLQSTVHSLQSTVHSPQSTVYSLQSTVYSLQSIVYSLQSTVHSPQSTVYSPQSTVYSLQSTVYSLFVLMPLHSESNM